MNITLNSWFFPVQGHLWCDVAIQSFVDVPFLLFLEQSAYTSWVILAGGVSEVDYFCTPRIIINLMEENIITFEVVDEKARIVQGFHAFCDVKGDLEGHVGGWELVR